MKQIISSLLLVLMLCGVSSCKNELDALEDGNHRILKKEEKPMLKTIRLSFGGDYITESEEPLLRADDGDTFTGINVFYTKKEENATEQYYAYGLIKKSNDISIDLLTGYTYRFESTILIEGEDKLYASNGNDSYYREPFLSNNGNLGGPYYKGDMDKFLYTFDLPENQKFIFRQLNQGVAWVDTGNDLTSQQGDVSYPRVKRYYGNLDGFDPALTNTVEIPMEYKSFGLKFVVESIPDNTTLTVMDVSNDRKETDDPRKYLVFPSGLSLNGNSEPWECLYSLNDFKKKTEDFTLRFTWNKGNNEKPEDFTHTFTVEAKKKKVLNIKIEGDVNTKNSGNIIFTGMSSEDDLDQLEEETENVSNAKNN